MRRLPNVLPPGTLAVGAGLGVLGAAAYAHLGIAGHALDTAGMSSISVFWSIVFTLGPGLFLPIEQEIARLVSARRVGGDGAGPVLGRGAILAGAVLLALIGLAVGAARPIAVRLFDGQVSMVWALCGALTGLALAHVSRGVLGGQGDFGWYGAQLAVDGALRIALAAALSAAGDTSPTGYALVLVVAPIVSVLVTLPPVRRAARTGPDIAWVDLCRGLALLTVSALLAQVVVNVAVVNARLLAPGDAALTAALLSALVLVRVPLFVFASLQASLLPGLSASVAGADPTAYRRLLARALGVVTALGLAGAVVAVAAGPWLARRLFDAPDVLGPTDFGWLAAGTLAFLWAMVLGQGILAINRHRDQAIAWVVGTVALVLATAVPVGVAKRVELGFVAGSLVTAALLYTALRRHVPRTMPVPDVEAPIGLGGAG
jgi:O-antigen/teichoic acid export membrane protein